jgi:cell division protease FtsH
VTRWGMSERVGLVSIARNDGSEFLGPELSMGREYSETLAALVDQEVRQIIDECHARARSLLEAERWRLEALAEALLREESLDEAEMLRVTELPPRASNGKLDAAPLPGEPVVHATTASASDEGPA